MLLACRFNLYDWVSCVKEPQLLQHFRMYCCKTSQGCYAVCSGLFSSSAWQRTSGTSAWLPRTGMLMTTLDDGYGCFHHCYDHVVLCLCSGRTERQCLLKIREQWTQIVHKSFQLLMKDQEQIRYVLALFLREKVCRYLAVMVPDLHEAQQSQLLTKKKMSPDARVVVWWHGMRTTSPLHLCVHFLLVAARFPQWTREHSFVVTVLCIQVAHGHLRQQKQCRSMVMATTSLFIYLQTV